MGVLIQPQWVLTTQACAWQARNRTITVLGSGNPSMNCTLGEQRKYDELFFETVNFSLPTRSVALFELTKPFPISDEIGTIPIYANFEMKQNFNDIVGPCYAFNYFYGRKPKTLDFFEVNVKPRDECISVFGHQDLLYDDIVCGSVKSEVVISPVVCKQMLYGFVSHQKHESLEILRLDAKLPWIRETIQLESERYTILSSTLTMPAASISPDAGMVDLISVSQMNVLYALKSIKDNSTAGT
ncbi:hypothetical protein Trydic_g13599 [Trypoxylus dichotomus]